MHENLTRNCSLSLSGKRKRIILLGLHFNICSVLRGYTGKIIKVMCFGGGEGV